jgi:hypothetical protein
MMCEAFHFRSYSLYLLTLISLYVLHNFSRVLSSDEHMWGCWMKRKCKVRGIKHRGIGMKRETQHRLTFFSFICSFFFVEWLCELFLKWTEWLVAKKENFWFFEIRMQILSSFSLCFALEYGFDWKNPTLVVNFVENIFLQFLVKYIISNKFQDKTDS